MTNPLDPTLAEDLLALHVAKGQIVDLAHASAKRDLIAAAMRSKGYLSEETTANGIGKHALRNAVQRFQRDAGLTEDGDVGIRTLGLLQAEALALRADLPAPALPPEPEASAVTEEAFRAQLVEKLQGHLREHNKDRWHPKYGPSGQWCAGFADKNLRDSCAVAGVHPRFFREVSTQSTDNVFSARSQRENARENGTFVAKTHAGHTGRHAADRTAKEGDLLVLVDRGGRSVHGHVTTVEKVLYNAQGEVTGYQCIGGNVSDRVKREIHRTDEVDLMGHIDSYAVFKQAEHAQKKSQHRHDDPGKTAAAEPPMPALPESLLSQLRNSMQASGGEPIAPRPAKKQLSLA